MCFRLTNANDEGWQFEWQEKIRATAQLLRKGRVTFARLGRSNSLGTGNFMGKTAFGRVGTGVACGWIDVNGSGTQTLRFRTVLNRLTLKLVIYVKL